MAIYRSSRAELCREAGAHGTLTPERLPLGVLATKTFDRAPETLGKTLAAEKRQPIEGKESFRWLEGYQQACTLAAECPDTRIVSLADREADIYDIFLDAQNQANPRADYIIRAHENRSTPERNREVSRRTYVKVREELERSPVLGIHTVALSVAPKRAAREARLEV